jgi:hypothetical protein
MADPQVAGLCGASVVTAYAIQTALALMPVTSLARLGQSEAGFELKAAALTTASLLAPPYLVDCDFFLRCRMVCVGNFSLSLHCGRDFRPFRTAGPCEAGARASLFSRLAE